MDVAQRPLLYIEDNNIQNVSKTISYGKPQISEGVPIPLVRSI